MSTRIMKLDRRRIYPRRMSRLLPFTCEACESEGFYDPLTTKGRFCNNACQGVAKRRETALRVAEGLVSDRGTLRRYLEDSRGVICELCDQGPIHNGKPLTLQVDHINGDSDNNLPSNLRLLCPNCHTQTDTFTGRNKKDSKRNRYLREYRDRNGHRS